MKLYFFVSSFLGIFLKPSQELSCWECDNAYSHEHCVEKGRLRHCQANEGSCQTEFRRIGWRPIILISKRCKQTLACYNNFIQNSHPAWKKFQCNMKSPSSVCRCCCSTDECNKEGLVCWDGVEEPSRCSPEHSNPKNGFVSCTDGSEVGSECLFQCDSGFILEGETVSSCLSTFMWTNRAPTCKPNACSNSLLPPADGVISCSNQRHIGSVCRFYCNDGFTLEGASQSICEEENEEREGVWSNSAPMCKRIFQDDLFLCKDDVLAPNNGFVICSNERNVDSVCAFSCNSGFQLLGDETKTCVRSGNTALWDNDTPTCQVLRCEPPHQDPIGGRVYCDNDNLLGSFCVFSCLRGYRLQGEPFSECVEIPNFGVMWSNKGPVCMELRCPPGPGVPENGNTFCSDGNMLGSTCNFTCEPDFRLVGAFKSDCVETDDGDIKWTNPVPICKESACEDPSDFPRGRSICTNGTRHNSICTFECTNLAFHIHPHSFVQTTCDEELGWDVPIPCCAKDCPPHAIMDLIIVLDSSSSVGMSNWFRIKNFIADFLQEFTISSNYTVYGVFRYNREVDTDTQILLKDFPDNKDALMAAFQNIPYNGVGTRTGNALRHVNDVMLAPENGNRAEANDVVLIITDGASQDEVEDEAKKLRDRGAMVYVVPIRPPQGRLDMDQVLQMVGKDEYIFKEALESGFEALTTDLSLKVAAVICGNPCNSIFHNHDLPLI